MSYNPDFTGRYPMDTYASILNTDGVNIYNSTGSQIDFFNISSSHALRSDTAYYSDTTNGINVNYPSTDTTFSGSLTQPSILSATANSGIVRTHATIKLNNKLYGGAWKQFGGPIVNTNTLYVVNDPDGDLTNITTSSFVPDGDVSAVAYSSTTGYLYFITTQALYKADPNDINNVNLFYSASSFPGGSVGNLAPIVCDGPYLYTIASNVLMKIDASTGNLIASSSFLSASVFVTGFHAGAISDDKTEVYFTAGTAVLANSCILKASTANLSYTIAGLGVISITDDICYLNGYVYAGSEADTYFVKIKASDLSIDRIPADMNTYGVFTDGVHIYAAIQTYNQMWVFPNGDFSNGPIEYALSSITGPNEIWITDERQFVVTSWDGTSKINRYNLLISQVGIDRYASGSLALDVAGTIRGTTIWSTNLSASIIQGRLYGTASWAVTASYALNALTSSYVLTNQVTQSIISSSTAESASWASHSFSSDFAISASWASQSLSSSYSTFLQGVASGSAPGVSFHGTSSWALNTITASWTSQSLSASWAPSSTNNVKAGVILASTFGGYAPFVYSTASILFGTPYSNANYAVTFGFQATGGDPTYSFLIQVTRSLKVDGFSASLNTTSAVDPAQDFNIFWITTPLSS